MKTFTATQLNKSPQEVFAAAKEDGKVKIKHDRYQGAFIINHVYTVSPAITAISKAMGEAFDGGAYIKSYEELQDDIEKMIADKMIASANRDNNNGE